MGYIEDLNEVIQIQRFQTELRKAFSERNQIKSLSKEIGENIEYYSKEFKEKTEEYTILQLWTIFERYLLELTYEYIYREKEESKMSRMITEKND